VRPLELQQDMYEIFLWDATPFSDLHRRHGTVTVFNPGQLDYRATGILASRGNVHNAESLVLRYYLLNQSDLSKSEVGNFDKLLFV
jgi:hypothetical protein